MLKNIRAQHSREKKAFPKEPSQSKAGWFLVVFCAVVLDWALDAAQKYAVTLQEPASSYMEALKVFNYQLLFVIIGIVLVVSWLLYATLENTIEFQESESQSEFNHSNRLEIAWTSIPGLILLMLASPSFSLLFSLDEVSEPDMTLKVFGHQWYWSYELSDFNLCASIKDLKYTSYMLTVDDIISKKWNGMFRNLETTRRVVLPTKTHLRLLVTSVDVLHSWAVPSLGVKVDACPGRLNLVSLFIKRFGLFFGQCSEICGVNHGFMPIVVMAIPSSKFYFLASSVALSKS